jgi:tetratricopeptide (TPR) repeat protein
MESGHSGRRVLADAGTTAKPTAIPFMGRERELAALLGGLEEALGGEGRLFLLSGEAGIGKSRLADELALRARERGARILWGRCWEAGGAPAYWPWVQALRAYVREGDPEQLRAQLGAGAPDVAQMLPDVRELFHNLPDPPSLDPGLARFRLFDAVASFLGTAARDQPLVLLIDDLHAADEPSLLLLQFVAGELTNASILIVGTYRDLDASWQPSFVSSLAELTRARATRRLDLRGLPEDAVRRVVEGVIGISPPAPLVAAIHERSEGNPLFVAELARLLASEGRLEHLEIGGIAIPEGIREVIGRRLDRLSAGCLELLTLASVLGREFGLAALENVTQLSGGDLVARLDEARSAQVATEVRGAPGRWRFSHALVREALYDDLGAADRMRLHRQVGEALEELYKPNPEPHLAELAHHFFHAAPAGEGGKAVDYARRAGDHAAGLLAYEEAARLYRMALRALELRDSGDETRCRLLLALGEVQDRGGDLSDARKSFLRAAETARKSDSSSLLAAAALGYGGRFVWSRSGDDHRVVSLLREALTAISSEDGPLRARLLARLSGALRGHSSRELASSVSEQAVDMARRIGDPATLSYTLEGRFAAVWWPENPEERLEIATEILQLAKDGGDPERTAEGHDCRGCTLMELGEVAAADAELAAAAMLVEELGQPAQEWIIVHTQAMRALFFGRFDEAESLIRKALNLGQRSLRWEAVSTFRLQMFLLLREQGRLDEAEGIIKSSVAEYPTRSSPRCMMAHLYSELRRPVAARGAFEALAKDGFGDIPRDNEWLFSLSLLPEVVDYLGDVPRAAILYDLLLPFAGRVSTIANEVSTGSVALGLGVLGSVMSRWDEAAGHFEHALEANERMGARPWAAHTRLAYARMLIARARPGDRERAKALLADAADASRELGMVAVGKRVSTLQEEVGLVPIPSAADPAPAPDADPRHSMNAFRREGEYWFIGFGDDTFRLKDSRGLRYLAVLLERPGQEMHALELTTTVLGTDLAPRGSTLSRKVVLDARGPGHAGELLDARAKAEYRQRLSELEEDVAEAEEWGDSERRARAQEEIDFLVNELAAAVGLGGRDRRASSDAERARVSVTKAIRSAMDRIRDHSASLGNHLATTIRTGTFCSYTPDPRIPVSWEI